MLLCFCLRALVHPVVSLCYLVHVFFLLLLNQMPLWSSGNDAPFPDERGTGSIPGRGVFPDVFF